MTNTNPNKAPEDLSTLVSCLRKARKDGFTLEFNVDESAMRAPEIKHDYSPSEVRVSNFYRFEGASDPADSAILYLIETSDGRKGTLIDAYGVYADPHISSFMDRVTEMNKVQPVQPINVFRMPLILAVLAVFFGILAVLVKRADHTFNPLLVGISLGLAIAYSIWSILDVIRAKHLLFYQRMFWLILTISVPFFGSVLYQLLHLRRNKIVS